MSNKASTGYTDELKIYVADAKRSTKNKKEFMEWERQRAYDLETGFEKGQQQKAIEDAVMLINDYKEKPEIAAKKMNAPLDKVLEALKQKQEIPVNA